MSPTIPGFSFVMDLLRIAHPHHPEQVEGVAELLIAACEREGVDAQQVRLLRRRLAVFRGEETEVTIVPLAEAPASS